MGLFIASSAMPYFIAAERGFRDGYDEGRKDARVRDRWLLNAAAAGHRGAWQRVAAGAESVAFVLAPLASLSPASAVTLERLPSLSKLAPEWRELEERSRAEAGGESTDHRPTP